MRQYLAHKAAYTVLVLLLVSMVSFVITMMLPGDPALAMLGEERALDEEAYQAAREKLGLNDPIPVQYLNWLGRVIRGDLGTSIRDGTQVVEKLKTRLPVTVELGLLSLLLALAIAIPTGVISAVKPNSKLDLAGTLFATSGVAIPHFWMGVLLIYVFALWLRWLPASGYVSPTEDLGANLRLMVMPVLTLGTGLAAVIMRQVRSEMLEVMRHEYVTTARSKGLGERTVVSTHALRNALIPVITIIGLQIGRIFGGTVVTETIFAMPGVGRMIAEGILNRDFLVVQGGVLTLTVAVVAANLITDILYAYLDPRIKYT